jgi:chemotaxis protein MotB
MDDESAGIDASGTRGSRAPWLVALGVLLASGALGYLGWQQLAGERAAALREKKAAAEMQRTATDLSQKLSAAELSASDLKAKLAIAESEAGLLRARADELSSTVKEKESELEKLKSTYTSLEDKLKSEIRKGEIRLTQAGGRIQVDLVDRILFDSGKAELSIHGKEVLSRVGAILTDSGDKQIQVSGHTDDSPIAEPLRDAFASNWELSAARAVNVVRHLAEVGKVPAKRLVAAGYGQFHPVADNADAGGRARNRRIELLLTPSLSTTSAPAPAAPQVKPSAGKADKPGPKMAKVSATKPALKRPLKRK